MHRLLLRTFETIFRLHSTYLYAIWADPNNNTTKHIIGWLDGRLIGESIFRVYTNGCEFCGAVRMNAIVFDTAI